MRCTLAFDDVCFEVDPAAGGRITSFRLGDAEALSGPDLDPNNYGSTLWTSPQADWGWPPPAEFDGVAYSVSTHGGGLTLIGPPNRGLGVRLEKRFAIDRARAAIVAEYSLRNVGAVAKACAPWEVTRVPPGGLTFFPTGTRAAGPLPVEEREGITWYTHKPETLDDAGQKYAADASASDASAPDASAPDASAPDPSAPDRTRAYVAHANRGLLLVKSFLDLPPEKQAPGEGEVEIYGNNRYVEVEAQGPYESIAPGAAARWVVTWYLRRIASPELISVGNRTLVDQVIATLSTATQ